MLGRAGNPHRLRFREAPWLASSSSAPILVSVFPVAAYGLAERELVGNLCHGRRAMRPRRRRQNRAPAGLPVLYVTDVQHGPLVAGCLAGRDPARAVLFSWATFAPGVPPKAACTRNSAAAGLLASLTGAAVRCSITEGPQRPPGPILRSRPRTAQPGGNCRPCRRGLNTPARRVGIPHSRPSCPVRGIRPAL